jgi:hypothetical protein
MKQHIVALIAVVGVANTLSAQDAELATLLKRSILERRQTLAETQDFCEKRVPPAGIQGPGGMGSLRAKDAGGCA